VSLAGEINEKLGIAATAIPGGRGQFDVWTTGGCSSRSRPKPLPQHDEILAQIG
jgi:hypothetical protein